MTFTQPAACAGTSLVLHDDLVERAEIGLADATSVSIGSAPSSSGPHG
jgi:hypothetical protein